MVRNRFRFSMRSLLCFVVGVSCILALLRALGPHLLWVPRHFESSHAALTEVQLMSLERDEAFARCQFGEVSFELPASMTKGISVARSGRDIWIKFADATRQVGIQAPQYKARETDSYSLLPIHVGMEGWSVPRLMREVCDCSSGSFSWNQSRDDLRRHQWAITQRRKQGLDANNFTSYSFEVDGRCEWILLSCDPASVDQMSRLRSVMIWEVPESHASGRIHFGDAARQDVAWIGVLAKSFRIVSLPAPGTPASSIANKTDSEILSMIKIDRGSAASDSR
jgi:hypothetical protein